MEPIKIKNILNQVKRTKAMLSEIQKPKTLIQKVHQSLDNLIACLELELNWVQAPEDSVEERKD